MFDTIYPKELQLNKSEAPFLDSHLSISNYIISTKIYDKRGDFYFVMVPVLDDYVSRATSYGVYFSHLFRFARASRHVTDFNEQNKMLISKLLKQRYRYHKLCKTHFLSLSLSKYVCFKHFCKKVDPNQKFMAT